MYLWAFLKIQLSSHKMWAIGYVWFLVILAGIIALIGVFQVWLGRKYPQADDPWEEFCQSFRNKHTKNKRVEG